MAYPPLEWIKLDAADRAAALCMAHLDHFNAAADRARKLHQERVEYREKKDIEDMVSTLVAPGDNRGRGDFISEEEYAALLA